jgi:hypothetical protein
MNVSQSALDAEALFYEAGSFSEVEGLDYIAEAEWIAIPVGASAFIKMRAEGDSYAKLDLVNARGVHYATQELSGSSVAMAFMVAQAVAVLATVAENSDI